MKRTLRTKIWCGVLAVACVSGVAFGVANLPRVQAEAASGGVEVTEAPGNEAVVSEESKAEVPEISGNPEISEVSETAEVSSAKEAFLRPEHTTPAPLFQYKPYSFCSSFAILLQALPHIEKGSRKMRGP